MAKPKSKGKYRVSPPGLELPRSGLREKYHDFETLTDRVHALEDILVAMSMRTDDQGVHIHDPFVRDLQEIFAMQIKDIPVG